MNPDRAGVALALFLGWVLLCIPVQWLLLRLSPDGFARTFPPFFHRRLLKILGIRVHHVGTPYEGGAVLVAANHTGYIDIPVIGSLAPLSFVAKSEVATWPLFGTLAHLQRSVFVVRQRRTHAAEQRDELRNRLAAGERIVLFPEGTSSDGNRVLPFKSSLMSAAEVEIDGRPVMVQPLSVAYVGLHGLPMGREWRPYAAWYGDMDLAPHLWELLSMGPLDIVIEWHQPVTAAQFGGRKNLTIHCERTVAEGVARALRGNWTALGAQPEAEPVARPSALPEGAVLPAR